MRMRLLTIAAVCLSATLAVTAQVSPSSDQPPKANQVPAISPEKQALVRELLDAVDFKKSTEEILTALFHQLEEEIPAAVWKELSEAKEIKELSWTEQQQLYNQIKARSDSSTKLRERLFQRADFVNLTEEITIELYGKYFSENELRDLILFYKSPAGKKSIEVTPSLLNESMTKTSERLMPLMREVMKEISDEEMAKVQDEVTTLIKANHKVPPRQNTRRKTRLRKH